MTDKPFLRKQYLSIRGAITDAENDASSQLIATIFTKHITLPEQGVIAGYYPINREISPLPLMQQLNKQDYCTALPTVDKQSRILTFKQWKPDTPLDTSGYLHIPTSADTAHTVTPDVIIVPLLAFTKHGHRLGYGGGYYDATLQHLKQIKPDIVAIGLGYACQEASHLPIEPHDIRLNCVVTEKGIVNT